MAIIKKGFLILDNRVIPVNLTGLRRDAIKKEPWECKQVLWVEYKAGPITYEVEQCGEALENE